jgi:hypothetical protein
MEGDTAQPDSDAEDAGLSDLDGPSPEKLRSRLAFTEFEGFKSIAVGFVILKDDRLTCCSLTRCQMKKRDHAKPILIRALSYLMGSSGMTSRDPAPPFGLCP